MDLTGAAKEVAQEFSSSLLDLTVNSKPHISMLTMLAEENLHHASAIVQAVEKHLVKVDPEYKLPVLYLIDSIVKNVGHAYTNLFTQNIVSTFCGVFEKVDEKTRAQMFKLRHTWNEMFPTKKLYAMDLRVNSIDPAWPIQPPTASVNIHVNPKFLNKSTDEGSKASSILSAKPSVVSSVPTPVTLPSTPPAVKIAAKELEISKLAEARMREELLRKHKELIELQQKKLEIELLQAQAQIEEQRRQLMAATEPTQTPQAILQALQAQQQQLKKAPSATMTSATMQQILNMKPTHHQTQPAPTSKPHSQAPSTSDSAQKGFIQQRPHAFDPRKAASTSETNSHTTPVSQSSVLADSRPKLSQSKPSVSNTNNNNKDLKVASKDTFLNKDPRTLNKRISPVPKSMANLASTSRSSTLSHTQVSSLPTSKPNLPKPKPATSTITTTKLSKATPSPTKVTPEIPVELDEGGKLSSSAPVKEGKNLVDAESSKASSSSSTVVKKSPSKNCKKSSSSVKSDSNSKSEHKKVSSKSSGSSDIHSSPKSHKSSVKSPKESRKALDKKKDRKRESESASGSKSPVTTSAKSKSDLKSGRVFKDVKGCRLRNYIHHRSVSESPEPPTESGDVDLRSGPLDVKIPHIKVFKDDPDAPGAKPGIPPPGPPFQLEGMSNTSDVNQDTLGKDVDLRQLPTSPLGLNKKRSGSADKSDHPSPKKSKAEMIDVLFGNEDVDLRTLAPPIVAPMDISNEETKAKKKAPDWARFKEVNPDTYKSPLKNSTWETSSEHGSHASDLDFPPPPPPPKLISPDVKMSKDAPAFDRLGRPLLYHRMSTDDPRERRPSMSSSIGEDTDMRHLMMEPDAGDDQESTPRNINIIIEQADEQLKNGTITISQYNILLKQMIHLNEVQKLREAQRRDEMDESWGDNSGSDGWDQDRKSQSPDNRDSDGHNSRDSDRSPNFRTFENEDAPDSTAYPKEGKFMVHGDIDERFAPPNVGQRIDPRSVAQPGRGRGMPPRGGGPIPGPPLPPRGPMGRPWPGPPGPPMPPGAPRPRWEEPGWIPGPQGPMPRHMVPRPGLPPHIAGPRPPHFRRGGVDFAGPRFPHWQQQQQQEHFNQGRPFPFGPDHFRHNFRGELPPVDPRELDMLEQEAMKTINIDGVPREIRHYGDTAIILMSYADPRELSFQSGTRRITFNDCEVYALNFGDNYREVVVDGMVLNVKFGAPTRELYINGHWYECFFGGPALTLDVNGKRFKVSLEGPAPQVKIGNQRRDLVAGKVKLMVDAIESGAAFLDPKPQKFVIDGKPHIFRFTEAFRTVIINGRPFRTDFGGLPMAIMVHGNKHYLSFSAMPPGIVPGYISITNMEGGRLPTPPPEEDFESSPGPPKMPISKPPQDQGHQPALPIIGRGKRSPMDLNHGPNEHGRGPMRLHQLHMAPNIRQRGHLDVLTNLMPGVVTADKGYSYQVTQDGQQTDKQQTSTSGGALPDAGINPASLNLGELMQKLVATGILPSKDTPEAKQEEDSKIIKPVTFTNESLKLRQAGIYTALYSGIQCSSCGVRFPPEQTIKYSQHLDWHFRQNRRDRDSAKKAQSRKWYYDVSDWIQFEEIEDLEERAQSWFETQVVERPEEKEQEMQSVPAGENSGDVSCAMCHENFEQFYNEDKEEWHLRDAIRVEDKTYHPVCYEDFKNALETSADESANQSDAHQDEQKVEPETAEPMETEVKEEASTDVKEENSEVKDEESSVPMDANSIKTEEVEETPSETVIKEEPMDATDEIQVKIEPSEETTELGSEGTMDVDDVDVKTEPVETSETEQSAVLTTTVDTTLNIVTSSIDGNMELEETAQMSVPTGKIKINISKPIAPVVPAAVARLDSQSDDETTEGAKASDVKANSPSVADEPTEGGSPPPPPPGDDTFALKPRLAGRKLTELPPVNKGTELSSLCSIM